MTRNITLAFVFTLASVVLLFWIWIQETSRLPEATAKAVATKIEFGQRNYEQYCAACHGLAAEGLIGPALNDLALRKGPGTDEFERPNGIKQKYGTLRNYIEATISAGVRGSLMPAWSVEFGGPMRPDQVDAVTEYISYLQGGNLTEAALDEAVAFKTQLAQSQAQPTPSGPTPTAAPVAAGDPAAGEQVFTSLCAGCHASTTERRFGPGLAGLFSPGGPPDAPYGEQLPNGKPITVENVAEWIRNGGSGQIGTMPPMGSSLTPEELSDLIAYLQTLEP